jgi:hypothetical protein
MFVWMWEPEDAVIGAKTGGRCGEVLIWKLDGYAGDGLCVQNGETRTGVHSV